MGYDWNPLDTLKHPINTLTNNVHAITNGVGLTHGDPAPLANTAPAQALSQFAGKLAGEYDNFKNGVTPTVTPVSMNTQQSDQDRATQQGAIGELQGVANGTTATAADSLLTRGTDAASRNAMGTAAQYSGGNPGDALRKGLGASNDAYTTAASTAGMQKANEQAAARGQLVDAANSMRVQDLGVAGANQNAGNAAAGANQSADLAQQQIDAQRQNALRTATGGALTAPMSIAAADRQAKMNNDAANSTAVGSIVGAGGKAVASDERLKTGIQDGSHDADAFLNSLAPRSYEWKNPADPITTGPGKHLGVIAQDMQPADTAEMGDGTKYIRPEVISSVLAGMGRLHDRVTAIEDKKKKDDGGPGSIEWGPNPNAKTYKPSSGGASG